MKIHEYQAKEILRRYGVATPRGRVTADPEEVGRICEELGGRCVVKAQIHAGGRGKGGGVKLAGSPAEAVEKGNAILGMQLVTPQTGPEGQKVQQGPRRGAGLDRPGALPRRAARPRRSASRC